jgi:hypothetical protein
MVAVGEAEDVDPPRCRAGNTTTAHSVSFDAVTWQPREGVRIATVTVPWAGGSVMAGRSLRLVEDRESQLELIVGAGWAATLIALALSALVGSRIWPGRASNS